MDPARQSAARLRRRPAVPRQTRLAQNPPDGRMKPEQRSDEFLNQCDQPIVAPHVQQFMACHSQFRFVLQRKERLRPTPPGEESQTSPARRRLLRHKNRRRSSHRTGRGDRGRNRMRGRAFRRYRRSCARPAPIQHSLMPTPATKTHNSTSASAEAVTAGALAAAGSS